MRAETIAWLTCCVLLAELTQGFLNDAPVGCGMTIIKRSYNNMDFAPEGAHTIAQHDDTKTIHVQGDCISGSLRWDYPQGISDVKFESYEGEFQVCLKPSDSFIKFDSFYRLGSGEDNSITDDSAVCYKSMKGSVSIRISAAHSYTWADDYPQGTEYEITMDSDQNSDQTSG